MTAPGRLDISVVMPAHNEADWLESAVLGVAEGLRNRTSRFEIVVVENGSTDRTTEVGRKLEEAVEELRWISLPEPNYGLALKTGLLDARGDAVVNFDVDWCDLDFLDRAVRLVSADKGPAIVVGSKRAAGSVDTRSLARRFVTGVFSLVLKRGFGLSVSDTHGVKAISREAVRPVAEQCRFGHDLFDTELILRAERAGLFTMEIPVRVEEARPARSSILRRIPRTLRSLAALRIALWSEKRRS